MSELPPPVTEDQFRSLEGSNKEQVRKRAAPFVRDLHAFLNRGSCLRDIQRIRRRLNPRIRSVAAFDDFAADREHWYTHNAGGRSEAQFNIGLFTDYLRVGLAFESSKKVHGDPEAVQRMYDSFTHTLRRYQRGFDKFAVGDSLQIEWRPRGRREREFVPPQGVSEWLLEPPAPFPEWIFVGRLLYRDRDATVLEDPVLLRREMETVFRGLKDLWEQAQRGARR